jgi:hypothetical protein
LYQISSTTLQRILDTPCSAILFSHLVTGVVIKLGFSLRTNANNCRGIVSNYLVVEWEMSRAYKFGTMVGFLLDSLGEDGCEGVNSVQLVVGADHKQWKKGFPGG